MTSRGAKQMGTSSTCPGESMVGGQSTHSARVFWNMHSMAMLADGSWLVIRSTASSMTVLPPGDVTKQLPKS